MSTEERVDCFEVEQKLSFFCKRIAGHLLPVSAGVRAFPY